MAILQDGTDDVDVPDDVNVDCVDADACDEQTATMLATDWQLNQSTEL